MSYSEGEAEIIFLDEENEEVKEEKQEKKMDECSICLEGNVDMCFPCFHWVHRSCYNRCNKNECPVCRMNLDEYFKKIVTLPERPSFVDWMSNSLSVFPIIDSILDRHDWNEASEEDSEEDISERFPIWDRRFEQDVREQEERLRKQEKKMRELVARGNKSTVKRKFKIKEVVNDCTAMTRKGTKCTRKAYTKLNLCTIHLKVRSSL